VNKPNHNQATPLYIACQQGHAEVVSILLGDMRVEVNRPNGNEVTPFYIACQKGHLKVMSLLLADTRIDVSKAMNKGSTPLDIACQNDRKEVVSLLLKDLRVDVNFQQIEGNTPFNAACQAGHKDVVSLLLTDMRVDVDKPANHQCTPLWFASQNGHLPIIQVILVSGREVNTKAKTIAGRSPWHNKTAAEMARLQGTRVKLEDESEEAHTRKKQSGPLIADLLDSFDLDPSATRQQLRELPELRDSFIGDLFALVIFLCDELLTVSAEGSASSPSTASNNKASRFFQMCRHLPIELQMVLCNRVFGAGKDTVLTKHSEPAFKKLGKLFTRSESL